MELSFDDAFGSPTATPSVPEAEPSTVLLDEGCGQDQTAPRGSRDSSLGDDATLHSAEQTSGNGSGITSDDYDDFAQAVPQDVSRRVQQADVVPSTPPSSSPVDSRAPPAVKLGARPGPSDFDILSVIGQGAYVP